MDQPSVDDRWARGRREEYYPTRAERSLLDAHAPDIIQRATPNIGDFPRHLSAIPDGGTRLISFLGGTIGNLTPVHRRHFLADLRSITRPDDSVLIGIDLVKDADVLVRAYDDAAGVTAAFNRNALTHLNWRLGADFRPDAFEHVAVWNPDDRRIEMHLLSALDQQVTLAALGMTVEFHRGETLLTEISSKFSPEQFAGELADAGFVTLDRWTAEPGYQLVLAGPADAPC